MISQKAVADQSTEQFIFPKKILQKNSEEKYHHFI